MQKVENKNRTEVFNYLSVVTSIILGQGLGNLLVGYAQLIQFREAVTFSWPYLGWIVLLLPVYVTYWWALWDYRNNVRWTFLGFFFLLIGPIGLYLITALLLPDNGKQVLNNEATYYMSIRSWLFGLWVILQVWGIMLSPWLKDGFKRVSFLNRYKYSQYFLLVVLLVGSLCGTQQNPPFLLDAGVVTIFGIVLIYLLSSHRKTIQA